MAKPPDIAAVIAHLRELIEQQRTDEALAEIASLLAAMSQKNGELQLRLMKALRQSFGRKSEKISSEQLSLLLKEIAPVPDSPAPAAPASAQDEPAAPADENLKPPEPKPRKGHGRKPLPADLPREEILHKVSDEDRKCSACGATKTTIGFERSEMLEYVPASFRVLVHLREKCACRKCAENVAIAPVADKVIDSGLPGAGLLAYVLTSKYKDSLPLTRINDICKRAGVDLAVSTLADWVAAGTEALAPIARAILREALRSDVLKTDDTGLKVLDRDTPNGIKRGHLWAYIGDDRWAAFEYTPNWKAEHPRTLLKDRSGYLMHDGYAGYDKLHENDQTIEVGCWAHARRKFVEALDAGDSRAAHAISLIQELYAIEREAKARELSIDERRAERDKRSRPVLDRLGAWMAETYRREPPKSGLARAIAYSASRWTALKRFLEDGRLPIDNNATEAALRTVALGRKNYLFAGSDAGGERAAIAYAIIGTCELNGVEPFDYLRDVFTKLASGWPNRRLNELLPPAWSASRVSQKAA